MGYDLQRPRSVVTDGDGNSPWAIFVRPESKICKPYDLKDVFVSVGMGAGSHFNVPCRLEKYLPLEHIRTVNTGRFGARLKALLDGEVEAEPVAAANCQLWWVPDSATPEVVHGYMRALNRAEQALERQTCRNTCHCGSSQYRPYPWDFSKFGRGEHFVSAALPREEFNEVFAQIERRGLDQYLNDRSPETLS